MMKIVSTVLGAVLVLTALIGFMNHAFMKMDLSPMHDVILLIVGAITLYFAIMGTEFQARYTNATLGVLLTLAGIITLLSASGVATAGGVDIAAKHVLKLFGGHLQYTTADGVRNLILGIIGLIAGFMPREKEIEIDMAATQHKVPTAR
ncbi:MAG TPA: hypothetical protein V6D22_16190 [Candidatus Obscuribacterales bacterium]